MDFDPKKELAGFNPQIPDINLERVLTSYEELRIAEKNLKKARRRALLVRTGEKIVVVIGVVAVCKMVKPSKKNKS